MVSLLSAYSKHVSKLGINMDFNVKNIVKSGLETRNNDTTNQQFNNAYLHNKTLQHNIKGETKK